MRQTCLFLHWRGGVAAALVDGGGLFRRRGEAGHVAAGEAEAASARVRGRHVDELRSGSACSINLSGLLPKQNRCSNSQTKLYRVTQQDTIRKRQLPTFAPHHKVACQCTTNLPPAV